jgi:glutathione S-transferase
MRGLTFNQFTHLEIPMNYVTLITVLSLVQFIFFGALVAKARGKLGVAAPAMSGSPAFDCLVRVHLNTMERLVLFMPLMWMATQFWAPAWVAAVGAVFLLGRMLYWKGYVKNPEARKLGNIVSMLPIGVLLLANLVGLARAALA